MSDFRFGADDYKLNYYPHEASDGMGGVDWDKVESVEIEFYTYVKERTCKLKATTAGWSCSACHVVSWQTVTKPKPNYCPCCGAKVVNE